MGAEEEPLMADRTQCLVEVVGLRNDREVRLLAERIQRELEWRAAQAEFERKEHMCKECGLVQQGRKLGIGNLRAAVAAKAAHSQCFKSVELSHPNEESPVAGTCQAEARARDANIDATIKRARELEFERIEELRRQHDRTAQRRAEVLVVVARERGQKSQARRARYMSARSRHRAIQERDEKERIDKQLALEEHMARITRMRERRSKISQDISRLNREKEVKADTIRKMAEQAVITKNEEPLRRQLEELTQPAPSTICPLCKPRPPDEARMSRRTIRSAQAGGRRPASAGTKLSLPTPMALPDAPERPPPPKLVWLDSAKLSDSASTDLPSGSHGSTGDISITLHKDNSDTGSTGKAVSLYE